MITMPDPAAPSLEPEADDPFLWLEEIDGSRALDWVREQNARTESLLMKQPGFDSLESQLRGTLDAQDRIPHITRRGSFVYNFWQDEHHKRGLWRRTSFEEFQKEQPTWEVLLDVDQLASAEGRSWVFAGANCLPDDDRHCLIELSDGGGDTVVVREFDARAKAFVPNGFELPASKSQLAWLDADTLLVGTEVGPGSVTDSGYPRQTRRWLRGTPIESAPVIFEGSAQDVGIWPMADLTPGYERAWVVRALDFYHDEVHLIRGSSLLKVPKPDDAVLHLHRGWALLELRSELQDGGATFPAGSLIVARLDDLLAGRPRYRAVFTPTRTTSLAGLDWTHSTLILTILDNVASRIEEVRPPPDGESEAPWERRAVKAPAPGTLSVATLHDPFVDDDPLGEDYLVEYTDFLTPDSLLLGRSGSDGQRLLKQRDAQFDASGLEVEQRFARSVDGTPVPYFVISGSARAAGGSAAAPTLLYGYGGFEVSTQPWYSGTLGVGWLSRGGRLAVANIRGGGEFGPSWHQAALRENRQRSFDDFIAVADDLVKAGLATPQTLGIMGGSNGGLLVGAVMLQRPDLFGAVACQVPLLDMRRYHHLLAGASWVAEYGDPDDPDDWVFISKYSPYQNVQRDVRYPEALFTTSTRDDRVHPGHARKMVARLQAEGHPALYFENTEGGHEGAADNAQRAHLLALEYAYLWRQLLPGASVGAK